jgi:hypothetical protein
MLPKNHLLLELGEDLVVVVENIRDILYPRP